MLGLHKFKFPDICDNINFTEKIIMCWSIFRWSLEMLLTALSRGGNHRERQTGIMPMFREDMPVKYGTPSYKKLIL